MPWCIRCGTGLSQHELVGTDSYRDLTHTSVYLALPIVDRARRALPGLDHDALDAARQRRAGRSPRP